MKLQYPNVYIIDQAPGIQGIYEAICQAAATCYQAVPKSGEGAKAFVNTLIKNGHTAMLEFGTVYYTIPCKTLQQDDELISWAKEWEGSSYVDYDCDGVNYYITTNLRYAIESGFWADNMMQYITEPTDCHPKRHTALFTASIGTCREFTRHRVFSFAQESTRYCNYSRDKFEQNIAFIIPSWSTGLKPDKYVYGNWELSKRESVLLGSCYSAETSYFAMIADGASPQEARECLPLATKSSLCMCGLDKDWTHFFDLRMRETTGKAHPDAKFIATKLWRQFKERGIEL